MFKKPVKLGNSAPLRSSDRRKLRNRVSDAFLPVSGPNDADTLVPEGLKSAKFTTTSNQHGILYSSSDGQPLWFTLGEGDTLFPTVYTLWKLSILPGLTCAPMAIEKLIGGADLMIPGIVESATNHTIPILNENDLAVVYEYGTPSPVPRAIGRMAVSSSQINENAKGKAIKILHTYQDSLWALGSQTEPPNEVPRPSVPSSQLPEVVEPAISDTAELSAEPEVLPSTPQPSEPVLTPEAADNLLRESLLQAIQSLSKLPPSSTFPIPASTFYSVHILPSRPFSSSSSSSSDLIKRSSFKKLSKLLQAAEKEGLLKTKEYRGDLNVVSVNASHVDVVAHRPHKTVGAMEEKEKARNEREKEEEGKVSDIVVKEVWRPIATSAEFFEVALSQSTPKDTYHTAPELRSLIEEYISSHNLIHPREPSFVLLDDALKRVLLKKAESNVEFLPRSELVERLRGSMQAWYTVDEVLKKGDLKPIQVTTKIRQGRKASTFITGFEAFLLSADFLAEELRKACASATSVNPLPGKSGGLEVMIQGKQIKAVIDLLRGQGVPKKWIETADLTSGGKK